MSVPLQHDRVEIIANDHGDRTTPSYVAFTDQERLIGDAAKGQVAINPSNTVFNVKRLLGRTFTDPTVQSIVKHLPYTVFEKSGKPYIRVQYRSEEKELVGIYSTTSVANNTHAQTSPCSLRKKSPPCSSPR